MRDRVHAGTPTLDLGLNLTFPKLSKKTKVVAIVCTKPGDVEIRMTIRRTWANPLYSSAVRDELITVFFLVGTESNTDAVEDEQQEFGDMLQMNVSDTYTNLVYKLLATYRWMESNHPDKFILKIDSDVVILLDKIASRLGSEEERTIQCYVHRNVKPVRNSASRWYIPESVYSEYYLPDYCSGPVYLLSPASLRAILKASRDAKVFEVEDAFFTGLLSKKGLVEIRHERGVWHRWKSSQPCVNGEGTVISFPVHNASPTILLQSWQHLTHLRCRWPIEDFWLSVVLQD